MGYRYKCNCGSRNSAHSDACDSLLNDRAPRIVCAECPAVVKLHYWSWAGPSLYEVWIECHGEHVFGTLTVPIQHSPQGKAPTPLMANVTRIFDSNIQGLFEEAERKMQEYGLRAKLLERYLKRDTRA